MQQKIKGLEKEVDAIRNWASGNSLIEKVYLYGSALKGNFHKDSDLDIAVVINRKKGDANKKTTWLCEAHKWRAQLRPLLKMKLHLERYDRMETPTVHDGIQSGSFLIYDAHNPSLLPSLY